MQADENNFLYQTPDVSRQEFLCSLYLESQSSRLSLNENTYPLSFENQNDAIFLESKKGPFSSTDEDLHPLNDDNITIGPENDQSQANEMLQINNYDQILANMNDSIQKDKNSQNFQNKCGFLQATESHLHQTSKDSPINLVHSDIFQENGFDRTSIDTDCNIQDKNYQTFILDIRNNRIPAKNVKEKKLEKNEMEESKKETKDLEEKAKNTEKIKDSEGIEKDFEEEAEEHEKAVKDSEEEAKNPEEAEKGPKKAVKDPEEAEKDSDEAEKDPDEAEKDPDEAEKDPEEAEKGPKKAVKDPEEETKDHEKAEKDPEEAEKDPEEAEKDSEEEEEEDSEEKSNKFDRLVRTCHDEIQSNIKSSEENDPVSFYLENISAPIKFAERRMLDELPASIIAKEMHGRYISEKDGVSCPIAEIFLMSNLIRFCDIAIREFSLLTAEIFCSPNFKELTFGNVKLLLIYDLAIHIYRALYDKDYCQTNDRYEPMVCYALDEEYSDIIAPHYYADYTEDIFDNISEKIDDFF